MAPMTIWFQMRLYHALYLLEDIRTILQGILEIDDRFAEFLILLQDRYNSGNPDGQEY